MESELLSYVFSNSIDFLAKVLTVYIDETYGRENIVKFLRLLHTSAPFLILNDFRVAKQQNALRKVDVLGNLLKTL